MMKVRMIETGAVVELEDDYALRMIEQGKATLYSGSAEGAAIFETGAILTPVNTDKYADSKRCNVYRSSEEALAGLTEMGFTSSDQIWKGTVKYFEAQPAPNRLIVSCYPKTETGAQAMAALREIRDDFYGFYYAGVTDDDNIKGIVAYVETNGLKKIMFCPIPNPVSYAVAADSLCKYFFDQQSDRYFPIYVSQPSWAAKAMGIAMGLRNANPEKWFTMRMVDPGFSQANTLSESEVVSLQGVNCNSFIGMGHYHGTGTSGFRGLHKGILSSGKRYEDKLAEDLAACGLPVPERDAEKIEQFELRCDMYVQLNFRVDTLERAAAAATSGT